MSQNSNILNYLKEGNSLSPMEALKLFGCWALSSRISDLHKEGHTEIKAKPEKGENGKVYARYYIKQEQPQAPAFTNQNGQMAWMK